MEDGEKRIDMEVNISRQPVTNIFNDSSFLKSFWIRCHSIFANIVDRKFMESELRFVLFCGCVLWIVYILSQIV
jgi:hypothetical protein